MVTHEESKPTEETKKKELPRWMIGSILPSLLLPSPMHIELAHKARLTPAQDHYVEVLSCMERGRAGPRSVGRSESDIARFISMINPTGLNRKKGRDGGRTSGVGNARSRDSLYSFLPSFLTSFLICQK